MGTRASLSWWASFLRGEIANDRLFVLSLERSGVDAIALVRRSGAIVEHMSQVSIALGAQNLGAPHGEAGVRVGGHVFVADRLREARPSGTRVKFGVRVK